MLTIAVRSIFSNLKRPRHGLIVPFDGTSVVLGKKGYIDDIPRMIGGGIDEGETPLAGATREFREETGATSPLTKLFELRVHAVAGNGDMADTLVYCFSAAVGDFVPSDDIKAVVKIPIEELAEVASQMMRLPDQWFDGKKGHLNWQDWGVFYGPIHMQAYRALKERVADKPVKR